MRLRRVDPARPGLLRRRRGRGFSFHTPDGAAVRDRATVERIRALAIPPAWTDVWICAVPNGHIQAVGTDAAGRRQYRYHDQWRIARDADKHDRALRLAGRLPRLRAAVAADLVLPGLGRERVLAGALRILDLAVLRAGGDEYAPDGSRVVGDGEGSFGLATLRVDHVRLRRGQVIVEFPGKGGIEQSVTLHDPDLHRLVVALRRGRAPEEDLLAWRVDDGWHDVTSDDVNARVKELAGEEFTAKDLRTWSATVLAAVALADGPVPTSRRGRHRAVLAALDEVAEHLGNTRAVARTSYVDPRVVECFERGSTVAAAVRRAGSTDLSDPDTRAALERAVRRMLRSGT
jgi:DNA topoisomerase I